MVGGYSMLDLASPTIYKEALIAVNTAKPVMVKDDLDVYYADTISVSGTSVVITKGGKTITITDANSVSSEGDIEPKELHLYRVTISGEISSNGIEFVMMIYSNKELKTGGILPTDTEVIEELNNYEDVFIYDNNNQIKTIAVYENLYVEDNKLEFNFYDDEGETSFENETTEVTISKLF